MKFFKRIGIVLIIVAGLAIGTVGARWVYDFTGHSASTPELDVVTTGRTSPTMLSTDGIILNLQSYLQTHPSDPVALSNLGIWSLQKARETGDPAYYTKAEGVLNKSLELDPKNYVTMIGLGSLALSRHQFQDAVQWGKRAQLLNPYNASIYGIIGDAQVELGEYTAAFDTYVQMVNLRPNLSSYARISYARELSGNMDGAITAMQLAVQAGAPESEAANWARVQLGNLYFEQGKYADAAEMYQAALNFLPDYPYAQAGLANVHAAQGDYATAISIYTHVVKVMPLPQFVITLGDIYVATGHPQDAAQQYALVEMEQKLFAANGVDVDAELALFDADHERNLSQALEKARAAYARRPSITVADVLAWTLYKAGDYPAAHEMMKQALKLGTRHALLDYHAGMIAYKMGDYESAANYLGQAISLNPHFSFLYAEQAKQVLAELENRKSFAGGGR